MAKAELESMGEDTDVLCESISKLREQIKALTGVDIMIDDNTFKSTTDILKELGKVWGNLSDSSQTATLELVAGKTRANNVAALLKNYEQIDEVLKSLGDAEGSAFLAYCVFVYRMYSILIIVQTIVSDRNPMMSVRSKQ